MTGILYIVATPMGNLEDITYRAVRVLNQVDLIAAEDTRHSRRLLNHYGISTPLTACHEHNEDHKSRDILDRIEQGQHIALISDAGTPLISDPGYKLVNQACQRQIKVVPVPGCNAAVAGLSAAGLPTDSFLFMGFSPRKQAALTRFLESAAPHTATLIFYESPKRITSFIKTAAEVLGNRDACVAREITKQYEEFIRGPLTDILDDLNSKPQVKGECVVFIHGAAKQSAGISQAGLEALIRERLKDNPKTAVLAKEISQTCNLPRKTVYEAILTLRQNL